MPDFGTLVVKYDPPERGLELKSFKMYLLEYRNLPIFHENAVNKVVDAVVEAAASSGRPKKVNSRPVANYSR